ncbi:MAG: protein kinase [Thermoanaerobaculia bacterium]
MTSARPDDFRGTDRFSIQRCLGSGAFGVVYQAFDRERNTVVALKTLLRADPAAIYRFKQEFRALADVVHPNLVALYELMSDGEQWFFTLELVDGVDFVTSVRGPSEADPGRPGATLITPRAGNSAPWSGDDSGRAPATPSEPTGTLDVLMLRHGLLQLAEGLIALHKARTLHRDIKPQNVLVTPEGRVVLLDFGLALELGPHRLHQSSGLHTVGTPAYMSPEQASGMPIAEPSDWYSVGVILYEALTGRLPFEGRPLEILMNKQVLEPPAPHTLVEGVPEDLDKLCEELLRRDPTKRPTGDELLHRLLRGNALAPAPANRSSGGRSASARLVGRQRHLDSLNLALRSVRDGHQVTMLVDGPSGTGKSSLVRQFLGDLKRREKDVVVLSGRCYERESVPYKALDTMIDALSQHLKSLAPLEVEALLPRDVLALARLFPVLRRVESVAGARRRVLEIPDSQEFRRRAFAALRELLARLADRTTLVLTIDDLHWGDLDSAALLAELLRPPDPPTLLLVGCYRTEDATTSPFLKALKQSAGAEQIQELHLAELTPAEAEDLVLLLLPEEGAEAKALARTIARESGGNPFFIDELVRFSQAENGVDGSRQTPDPSGASLRDVIQSRIDRLPADARTLLQIVAVAGEPVERTVARSAAGLDGEATSMLALLQAAHLLRTRGTRQVDGIETYHDQIRQTVLAGLSPETLAAHHRNLARALEASNTADPESLAVHFQGAGEVERAAEYVAKAASQANETLAFDRAARLFRTALELRPASPAEARGLLVKLGDALANAGRGAEAAEAYLRAAEGAQAADNLEYMRRAAEQFLRSGHIDRGLIALRTVLHAVGRKLAESPRKALASLLLQRAWIRLRGLSYVERDPTQIAAEVLTSIDICWSVAMGLGVVDTLRGSEFQARHLLLALKAGEPSRVARAMAIEVGYSATGGNRTHKRTEELIRKTAALAKRVDHPHALAFATFTAGLAAYLEGRWRNSHDLCEQAEGVLREKCTAVAWEVGNCMFYSLRSLFHLGELNELARRLPTFLKDVQERGDLYGETNLRTRIAYVPMLAADRVEGARQEVRQILDRWSHQGFHLQHYFEVFGQVEIDLYAGDGPSAWNRLMERWPALRRSLFQRIQLIGIESYHLHGRAALAAAVSGLQSEALLAVAEKDAARIEREKTDWGHPFARMLSAGIAATRGEHARAVTLLVESEEAFTAGEMALYAIVARRCRGTLLGGTAGDLLTGEANSWMAQQGIVSSERMTALVAPGLFRRR